MEEAWLRGPVEGVTPVLTPAAHALIQAREDILTAAGALAPAHLWARPAGAPSVGFHLRHIAGSVDRLLTYARGQSLTDPQKAALAAETGSDDASATPASLAAAAAAEIEQALVALRAADPATLHAPLTIGRAKLPSTVFGVLFHIAEHAQRHVGQIVATAKIVKGLSGSDRR